jgi:ribonuclease P protein component
MFVVPKRSFKRAHDRNLLRRRSKEAYRLVKENFYQKHSGKRLRISIGILYTAKKSEEFLKIQESITNLLNKIENISEQNI